MVAVSVSCRGTMKEKLQWMFDLFDLDSNGSVTKEEMTTIIKSIHKVNKNMTKRTPEEHVDEIFAKLDRNKDGFLTLEEFLSLGNIDPQLVKIACASGKSLAN